MLIKHILYINSVSLLVCPGRYILNPCEQGVVFVFNVPFWTCLFVWTKIGQCMEDSSSHYPFLVEHLIMIFIFFVEAGRGWGSRGLNRWKWKRTHCNIMLGNTLGTKEKWKETLPPAALPSSQNLKRIKARHLECTLGPSIGCMKFLFSKKFIIV